LPKFKKPLIKNRGIKNFLNKGKIGDLKNREEFYQTFPPIYGKKLEKE